MELFPITGDLNLDVKLGVFLGHLIHTSFIFLFFNIKFFFFLIFEVKFTYHKITHLKVCNSVAFSTFKISRNHNFYLCSKYFYNPNRRPCMLFFNFEKY